MPSWLCIVALGQAALLGVVCASAAGRRLDVLPALRFASGNAWPVLQVTARMVAFTLLTALPFLAVAGGVYMTLLSEYDINYYLKQKPPEFLIALSIGGLLAIALACVLLRMFSSWRSMCRKRRTARSWCFTTAIS